MVSAVGWRRVSDGGPGVASGGRRELCRPLRHASGPARWRGTCSAPCALVLSAHGTRPTATWQRCTSRGGPALAQAVPSGT